jgi:hypothetical protein
MLHANVPFLVATQQKYRYWNIYCTLSNLAVSVFQKLKVSFMELYFESFEDLESTVLVVLFKNDFEA